MSVSSGSNFYPRSPCGERRDVIAVMTDAQSISIHALLAESDFLDRRFGAVQNAFLSTLSLRRATAEVGGSDQAIINFYPRSPCGERLMHALKLANAVLFLSTLSLRRATVDTVKFADTMLFLSTLSLRRATQAQSLKVASLCNFYPRSPCGERHCNLAQKKHPLTISIHALLAESDEFRKLLYPGSTNFYPRSPCGERPSRTETEGPSFCISIHALLAESDHKRGCII